MLPFPENDAQNTTHENTATLPIDAVATSTTPHEYQPLDSGETQIRLLKIVPGGRDESIHCMLSIFSLNPTSDKRKFYKIGKESDTKSQRGKSSRRYLALSYTWGAPKPSYNIFVNGDSFQVRENLYRFLIDYRDTQEDEYLWIDQICIDQSNLWERSSQVQIMGHIYSGSASVIVWLGDNSEELQKAARYLAHVNIDIDSHTSSDWDYLIALSENRYFTRLWIVQEVLLAPKIRVLVPYSIWVPWETIMWIFTDGCETSRSRDGFPSSAYSVLYLDTLDRYGRHLSMLLERLRENQCEEPRDRLYALGAIVRLEERLPVDYSKSITEVFLDALAICFGSNDQVGIDEINLLNLGRAMGFSEHILEGLEPFLQAIFNRTLMQKGAYESKIIVNKGDVMRVGYESPAARMQGVNVQNKNQKRLPGRWWFEYNKTRVYYDCGVPDNNVEVRHGGDLYIVVSVERKVRSPGGIISLEPQHRDDTPYGYIIDMGSDNYTEKKGQKKKSKR